MYCVLLAPHWKAKSRLYLHFRWNTWCLKCIITRLGDTIKTENLCQYWSSLKHKQFLSLWVNELGLSSRSLEIMQKWLWLESLITNRVKSFGKKRDSSLVTIVSQRGSSHVAKNRGSSYWIVSRCHWLLELKTVLRCSKLGLKLRLATETRFIPFKPRLTAATITQHNWSST